MNDTHGKAKRGLVASLRASFLTGLVVVLPVGLTIYLVWAVVGWIDAWILPLIPASYQPEALLQRWFGPEANYPVRGLGVVVFLIFTIIIGWIAKGLIGRSVLRSAEGLVDRMPVVRSVYTGLKQIAETVFTQSANTFDRCCLVEFPRAGMWSIGFYAGAAKGEVQDRIGDPADPMMTVYLPTTPNPTSGYVVFVKQSEVVLLDMSIEDTAKLIISAGLIYPTAKDPAAALPDQ
jgi:uncharacterized membrane protein